MRAKRTIQSSIFERYPEHEVGDELKAISQWLDAHPELLELVGADVGEAATQATGRKGLSIESVLRCAILKQSRQLSYDDLAFYLMDSMSFQAFSRLCDGWSPQKTALQGAISRISCATWEQINHALLQSARRERLEDGRALRIDSTVTESDVHAPTDNSLLWDSVRTLNRLYQQACQLPGEPDPGWHNHQRVAKKRMRAIIYVRGKEKRARLYRDLLDVTHKTLGYIEQVEQELIVLGYESVLEFAGWREELRHYKALIHKVIDQTERRVFHGETVAADEKVFSLFEEHTDIIVKGSRDIQYGHKLNLGSGRSGLILDAVIELGNPADSEQFLPMLDRHIQHYGVAPRQSAADGCYASSGNLQAAKERGVKDVVFHKKRGLKVDEMAKSAWVYRKLRNFRAGIEAGISCLKRSYGLARCTWKGLAHFKAYVWSSVVAYNLTMFARLKVG